MKRLFLLVIPILFFVTPAFALQIPEKPQSYVNDYAEILSADARSQIENTLAEFEKASSTQIVVAIFPNLEGEALEDYSIRLAEKWKIGSKKNNNGVILLIFKEDRKVRIEVGYGLEGALPDVVASQIIRNQITPAFREGNFDKGVLDAVQAIMLAARGEYKASSGPSNDLMEKYSSVIFVLMILFILLPVICYIAIVFLCMFFFGFPDGLLVGVAAAIFLFILRQAFTSIGLGTTFASRGGYWSGSGFGGGFSGGGFSGGGGGSFGGGGASGRW